MQTPQLYLRHITIAVMKKVFAIILFVHQMISVHAQFPYNPLPAKGADFDKFKINNIHQCVRFQVDSAHQDSSIKQIYRFNSLGQLETTIDINGVDDNDMPDTICRSYFTYTAAGMLLREYIEDKEYGESISLCT